MSTGALSRDFVLLTDFVVGVDTSEHGLISCNRFRADIKARKGGWRFRGRGLVKCAFMHFDPPTDG